MNLKQARKMALSGEPMTKTEYDAAYRRLVEAAYHASLWLCGVFLAALATASITWKMGTLNGWIIGALVVAVIVVAARAANADAHVRFLPQTAQIFRGH